MWVCYDSLPTHLKYHTETVVYSVHHLISLIRHAPNVYTYGISVYKSGEQRLSSNGMAIMETENFMEKKTFCVCVIVAVYCKKHEV